MAMKNTKKHVVAAAMRNEGPFILEWVAWYKSVGFDDVLVATNDCSDHSVELLKALETAGWVHHVEHVPPPERSAKYSAHRALRAHPSVDAADWLFVCDVDEFLVLHADDGTVQGFLGDEEPDVHGIAFHWKCFGTSGHQYWQDGLVHRQFTMAAPEQSETNIFFKSLIHRPAHFRQLREHRPQGFLGETWGEVPNVWVNGDGAVLPKFDPSNNQFQYTRHTRITHANAQVNHYIVRAAESFDLKRGRLDPTAGKNRHTDRFFNKFNRNDELDETAMTHAARFEDVFLRVCETPGALRLHHLCCADYVVQLCAKRGDDPKQDARFVHHMAMAETLK